MGDLVLAAGKDAIFRSTNNGASFTKKGLATGIYPYSGFLGGGKWITFRRFSSSILLSTNDGEDWFELANTLPVSAGGLAHGFYISQGTILVTGAFEPYLAISQDGGAIWQIMEMPFADARSAYLTSKTAFIGSVTPYESPFLGKPKVGKLAIVDLSDLAPPLAQSFPMLSLSSWDAGATSTLTDSKALMLPNDKSLTLTAEGIYNALATTGAKLHVRSSADGIHYDTDDLYEFTLPFSAGGAVRKTYQLEPNVRFLKVLVENLDGQAISDVKVTATVD